MAEKALGSAPCEAVTAGQAWLCKARLLCGPLRALVVLHLGCLGHTRGGFRSAVRASPSEHNVGALVPAAGFIQERSTSTGEEQGPQQVNSQPAAYTASCLESLPRGGPLCSSTLAQEKLWRLLQLLLPL